MRPLLSYYGGKHRYVEPFSGGASLFFALPEKPPFSILNDTRDELINYYRVVQTNPQALKDLIDATLYSESDWRRAKRLSSDLDADPVERAWGTHIKISQSYSRKGDTWARAGGNKWCREFRLRVDSALRLRDHVEVSCEDAIKCIQRTDRESTFFYVDPPYPGSSRQNEWQPYEQEDWERLIETLNTIQGSYLLSGYPNDVTPRDCETFSFTRHTSAARVKGVEVTECLWRRLNPYHSERLGELRI